MNIYQKLAKARRMLQDSKLTKTGAGYGFTYFELSDFLPRTTEIFDELGLSSFTSITKERGTMTISDGEGSIVFEVPFGEFKSEEKRKLQPVQEIGASITYTTRYLWVQVMNIVEPDRVDSRTVHKPTPNVNNGPDTDVSTGGPTIRRTYTGGRQI